MELLVIVLVFICVAGYIIARAIEKGHINPINDRLERIEKRLYNLENK